MVNEIGTIKKTLTEAISQLCEVSWMFTKDPGRDFTRKRKLPFDKVISFLLAMEGGNLTTEMLRYFGCSSDIASNSAFVLQRGKSIPLHFPLCLICLCKKQTKIYATKVFIYLLPTVLAFRSLQILMIQIPISPLKKDNLRIICFISMQCTICLGIPIQTQFCSAREKQTSEVLFVTWLTGPLLKMSLLLQTEGMKVSTLWLIFRKKGGVS